MRLLITPELLLKIRRVWTDAEGGSKWDNIMLLVVLLRFPTVG